MNALDIAIMGQGDMFPGQSCQKLQARLDLFDESIILTKYVGGNPVTAYEVDPIDLAASFGGQPITTGRLPRGVLHYTRGNNKENITIVIPAHQRLLTYSKNERLNAVKIPLPTLIFRGHHSSYQVWAIKNDWPEANELIFRAPLSNVSGDGYICTGDVPFPLASKDTIWKAAKLFLDSVFNSHYDGNKSEAFPTSVLLLWESLQGEVVFPLDDLISTKTTLEKVLQ